MALTTQERDAMPAGEFAVPGKRALPIHDATHVKMAWKMVDRTHGLSDEERKSARAKILTKAHELGINTDEWHAQAITLEAMAIDMPNVKDHPNRVPFSGILTRLDKPSDSPLGGSFGKCVVLPSAIAEKALPSLLGMAVDFTPHLDGHDSKNKIGLITEANIQGDAIHISGFFYGADFPDEVKRIQADKASLGFSFEAQTRLKSLDDNPLVIDYCVFTGAAVLQKDKAAYTTTALSAKAEINMSDSNENALQQKVASLAEQISQLTAKLEAQKEEDENEKKLKAGSVAHMVKEHADRLRAAASSMCAAGMGMHPKGGHVAVLHDMADKMEADAAMGKLPHVYYTNDWLHASSSKKEEGEEKKTDEFKSLIEGLKTEISDLKKAKFDASADAPARKTFDKGMINLFAKTGLNPSDDKLSIHQIDAALDKTPGLSRVQSIAMKLNLQEANAIK